jgi:O-antigen ligase
LAYLIGENKNNDKKYIELGMGVILSIALFFTFSKAGWLVIIMLLILHYIYSKKKDWNYLVVCGLSVMIMGVIFWPLVSARILPKNNIEIMSYTERMEMNRGGIEMWKQNKWLGVGMGNYTNELIKNNPGLESYRYQPVHNIYLIVLAEVGIVGYLFILSILYFLIKKKMINKDNFYVWFFFFFLFFFDHYFWTMASGLIVGLFSLFLLNNE